ncbi:hypothetical protein, partial [Azospirillum sp. B4]|uniref:hypothetical protein n=1 Tax=Azospirillum sp. B4 TaxID=95605 RepID=UPI001900A5EE
LAGGNSNSGGHLIYWGWNGNLTAQVDSTDFGNSLPTNISGNSGTSGYASNSGYSNSSGTSTRTNGLNIGCNSGWVVYTNNDGSLGCTNNVSGSSGTSGYATNAGTATRSNGLNVGCNSGWVVYTNNDGSLGCTNNISGSSGSANTANYATNAGDAQYASGSRGDFTVGGSATVSGGVLQIGSTTCSGCQATQIRYDGNITGLNRDSSLSASNFYGRSTSSGYADNSGSSGYATNAGTATRSNGLNIGCNNGYVVYTNADGSLGCTNNVSGSSGSSGYATNSGYSDNSGTANRANGLNIGCNNGWVVYTNNDGSLGCTNNISGSSGSTTSSSGFAGNLVSSASYNNSFSWTNNSSSAQFVLAWGGQSGTTCYLYAFIDGSQVAVNQETGSSGGKVCMLTVPLGQRKNVSISSFGSGKQSSHRFFSRPMG